MEATLKKAGFDCWNTVYRQSLVKEESVDSVVPDTMPDIKCILCARGDILIRSKDVSAGRIKLEANIPARVCYVPEGGEGVCTMDVNIPMFVSLESELICDGDFCDVDICLDELEARALNPRKITVYARAVFTVRCSRPGVWELPCAAEEDAGINILEGRTRVVGIKAVTEKTFILTDEYPIPPSKPAIAQIVGQNTSVSVEEVKSAGNKAIIKGRVSAKILYISDENKLCCADFSSSFSQVADCGETEGEPSFDVRILLSGAYFEPLPGSEGRTVGMELHLVAQLTEYEELDMSYISDAYSCTHALTTGEESREISAALRCVKLRETLRETVQTRLAVSEIVSVLADSGEVKCTEDGVEIPVRVCLMYRSADGELCAERGKYTLKMAIELEEGETVTPGCPVMQEIYSVPSGSGVEIRLPVELEVKIVKSGVIKCICALSYDEDDLLDLSDRPAMVIVPATSDSDLWQLAKCNNSTVEAIVQVNGLADCAGVWEKYIVIPKVI